MKRNFVTFLILFLLLMAVACQPTTGEQEQSTGVQAMPSATAEEVGLAPVVTSTPPAMPEQQWKLIKTLQPEHKPRYAAFQNELLGVTDCGENIQPSFTVDGGQTWTRPVMGKFCPDSVDIVDGRSIWLCNSFGVFTSKDGGRSLSQMYSPYEGCRILSFADDQHGWSSFDWNLAATDDGALRWLEVEKDYTMGDIAAVSRRSPVDGYVLTYDGTFFTTNNSGESWTSNDIELISDEMRIANMDGRPPVSMHFQDAQNGIMILALAGQGNASLHSLHTTDGGQSWQQHPIPMNLGSVYLSHDGRFLTVTELGGAGTINILENQSLAE